MNHQFLLNDFIIEKHVKNALEEDIGYEIGRASCRERV